jgi:RNA 2',3'-cyclic 3'-phosphodiesterase
MRAFVAVEVPPIGAHPKGIAPTPAHLTLLFLGEVALERAAPIADRLGEVGRTCAPFDLRIEGVGAFPSATAPRIVWVGTTVGSEEVGRLAEKVRATLHGEGSSAPEDRFVPHVTWFRVRSATDRCRALDLLEGRVPALEPQQIRVQEFVLKESVLGRGGAVHRTIAAFPLTGTAPLPAYSAEPAPRASTSLRQR